MHKINIFLYLFIFFYSDLANPEITLLAMLGSKVNSLPNHIQSVYVQNILKILNIILKGASQEHAVQVIYDIFQKLCISLHNVTMLFFITPSYKIHEKYLFSVFFLINLHNKSFT